MSGRKVTHVGASVRQRLLDRARAEGRVFQELATLYAMERFLFRLGASPHAERFVLKGGLMTLTWAAEHARITRDIDLLGRGANSIEAVVSRVRDVLALEVADGVLFDVASVEGTAITAEAAYVGVRASFDADLGGMRLRMQVDVGFGDAVVPEPRWIDYPQLLDFGAPRLLGYPAEATLAEKLHAIVVLGFANSRMKDYYDLWTAVRLGVVTPEGLGLAIRHTFARRSTPLPATMPEGLTRAFAEEHSKQSQWAGFVRKSKLEATRGTRRLGDNGFLRLRGCGRRRRVRARSRGRRAAVRDRRSWSVPGQSARECARHALRRTVDGCSKCVSRLRAEAMRRIGHGRAARAFTACAVLAACVREERVPEAASPLARQDETQVTATPAAELAARESNVPATPPSICARAQAYRWRESTRQAGSGIDVVADTMQLGGPNGNGYCWPTAHGAWAVGLPNEGRPAVGEFGERGRRRVMHLGNRGRAESALLTLTASDLPLRPESQPPLLFDFDGDGEPEIFFSSRNSYEDAGCVEAQGVSALVTYRDSVVSLYGPYRDDPGLLSDEVALRDVDGDGRPDMVVSRLLADGGGCRECSSAWGTPELVGHSKPDGTFDFGDEVARKAVSEWCPRPPRSYSTPNAVLCARAWGRSSDALVVDIEKATSEFDCAREAAGMRQKRKNANRQRTLMFAVARMPLPLTLRQGAGARP